MKLKFSLSVILAVVLLFFGCTALVLELSPSATPDILDVEEEEEPEDQLFPVEMVYETLTDQVELPNPSYSWKKEDRTIESEGVKLSGTLWKPETDDERIPLIIGCYGLGGTKDGLSTLAESLAAYGYAFASFNLRGKENPDTQDPSGTSVLTQTEDIEIVIEAVQDWDFVDSIIVLGQSQGGLVGALAAAELPEAVDALILEYPAFNLSDIVRFTFEWRPLEDFTLHDESLSRQYAQDLYDLDAYSRIGAYTGPVLILHGSEDPTVPLNYSRWADMIYEQSELIILEGAGHGFKNDAYQQSVKEILAFLLLSDIPPAS